MKPTMPDGSTVDRKPRRARPPAMPMAAAILSTAAMALFTAACSSASSAGTGSPSVAASASSPSAASSSSVTGSAAASATASSSATAQSAVAYSQCMRANGVPKYPDPANGGSAPKGDASSFDVSASVFQAAQSTCQHLLPTGGPFDQQANECIQAGDCPPALVQQMLSVDRAFAQCMRSHGVPNWPDPTIAANGAPVFVVSAVGITHSQTHSPPMSNTIMQCTRVAPAPAALA